MEIEIELDRTDHPCGFEYLPNYLLFAEDVVGGEEGEVVDCYRKILSCHHSLCVEFYKAKGTFLL